MNTSTLQVGPPLVDATGASAGRFGDVAHGSLVECVDDGALELEVGGVACVSERGESLTGLVGEVAALGHGHIMNCSRFGFTSVSESDTLEDMSTARTTTPTGVPIEDCGECGRRHPVTRSHCGTCGSAALFCHPGDDRTPAPARKDA